MNATPAGSEWRRDGLILGLLVLAYVLTRVAWVLLEPNTTLYWEEDHRWASAEELLSGVGRPLLDYQADHYQGGSLVLVLMVTALFGAFGPSLLGLKLAAVGFGAATLVALYVLGRSCFGRSVGVLAAAALLTGPPLLAFSGLVGMGSHGESALFSAIQILLFAQLLSSRSQGPGPWLAFGLVSGLGLWFCYTSGLSLLACAITWLMLEDTQQPKQLLAAAAGACAGLTPWLVYNVQYDFRGARAPGRAVRWRGIRSIRGSHTIVGTSSGPSFRSDLAARARESLLAHGGQAALSDPVGHRDVAAGCWTRGCGGAGSSAARIGALAEARVAVGERQRGGSGWRWCSSSTHCSSWRPTQARASCSSRTRAPTPIGSSCRS